MSKLQRTEFLERETYRQRRLRDALKVLPVFGLLLVLLPMFWPWTSEEGVRPSSMILYIFGLWIVLVGLAAAMSHYLRYAEGEAKDGAEE